jgi:hypothetical protein
MEKKNYIIVTANNTWVSTLVDATSDDLKKEIEMLKEVYPEDEGEYYAYEYIGQPLTF